MWTSKPIAVPCPACGGCLRLTLSAVAKDTGTYSLAGAQLKVAVEVKPQAYCVGMADPPLGDPMWEPCGWSKYGEIVGDEAVFAQFA